MTLRKMRTEIGAAAPRVLVGFLLSVRSTFLGYPPPWTDLVGYESLLAVIKRKQVYALEGDIVEIGCFCGGGTAKLARFFSKHNKKVYAVDIFDPTFDQTKNLDGNTMSSLYSGVLGGRKQEEVFRDVTKKYSNVIMIKGDSKKVVLPCERICFAFIDGCHDPDYVKNDFYLVWGKTVSGGIVGFHDYDGNLPQTTKAIDELIEANANNISSIEKLGKKWIILLTRR
jgi:hypothetical protein